MMDWKNSDNECDDNGEGNMKMGGNFDNKEDRFSSEGGENLVENYSLDDYIYSLQASGRSTSTMDPNYSENDLMTILQNKDKDLVLAAELGKALLEKNEELSKENERIAEEFSHKLESLEQEKYLLRKKLDSATEEYDLRVGELQSDIANLRQILQDTEKGNRLQEKEKSLLISQLTEQNQRLTHQLKESTKVEESLTCELQTMRDMVNNKKNSMSEHVTHLETLREEINIMQEKKLDLERRIEHLYSERDGLSSTLDESADRIVMLEREAREQDNILRTSRKEIDELKSTNSSLADRLDSMYRSASLSPYGNRSLLTEMEVSDSEKSLNGSRRPFSNIDEDLEDIEFEAPGVHGGHVHMEAADLKQEVINAYAQLRNLVLMLRQRGKQRRASGDSVETTSSSEEVNISVGTLTAVLQELKGLLHDLLRVEAKGTCLTCGADSNQKIKLEVELHRTQESHEKLERQLKQHEESAKKRDDEIRDLMSKLSVTEIKLKSAEEERNTLREDLQNSDAGRDVLIKKAWETRDAAVKRKNNTEIELAKTRIDVMQVNSQLMEAVKQKVTLSQQLDQWQQDVQELLMENMNKKIAAGRKSGGDSDSSQPERKKSHKILAFLKLGGNP